MQIFDEIRLWLVVLALLFGCQTLVLSMLMKYLVKISDRFLVLEKKFLCEEKSVEQEDEKDV